MRRCSSPVLLHEIAPRAGVSSGRRKRSIGRGRPLLDDSTQRRASPKECNRLLDRGTFCQSVGQGEFKGSAYCTQIPPILGAAQQYCENQRPERVLLAGAENVERGAPARLPLLACKESHERQTSASRATGWNGFEWLAVSLQGCRTQDTHHIGRVIRGREGAA